MASRTPRRADVADIGRAGLIVVDKPSGPTSHDVVSRVRRVLGGVRVGHAGTLDPLATGVLPILLGPACRLLRYLPGDPKVYRVRARLGLETDTGDIDGEPIAAPVEVPVDADALRALLPGFVGVVRQTPPRYSAKKVAGQRLYALARSGRPVDAQPIEVTIHAITLVDLHESAFTLEVSCSPGTYVRSLVTDLGRALGPGATVEALRRLSSGPFRVDEAVEVGPEASRSGLLARAWPIERIPLNVPDLCLNARDAERFCSGQSCVVALEAARGTVAVRESGKGRLLGIAEATAESGALRVQPRVVLQSRSSPPGAA